MSAMGCRFLDIRVRVPHMVGDKAWHDLSMRFDDRCNAQKRCPHFAHNLPAVTHISSDLA
jgi:hypothetical protein